MTECINIGFLAIEYHVSRHTMIVNAAPRFATILCLDMIREKCVFWRFDPIPMVYIPLVGEL